MQTWDPALYDNRHSFVYKAAAGLVELLDPQPGERILDLGCGTGHLTQQLAERGCRMTGFDLSAEMIREAKKNFPALDLRVADATSFTVDQPQDAVFSNAVLHWVRPPADAARAIFTALRPGGRLVAEFGGYGCIGQIVAAVKQVLPELDIAAQWYFPTVGQYAAVLESEGFEVRFATLFDRPTPLDEGRQGLRNWLQMFAGSYLARLDEARRDSALAEVERRLDAALWQNDQWVADYRRLRVVAVKLP